MQIAPVSISNSYKYNNISRVVKNQVLDSVETPVNTNDAGQNSYYNRDLIAFGQSGTMFKDCVTASARKRQDKLNQMSAVYLDVLESIAMKLKEFGVSFDRAYNEMHPVKSPEAYTSKIVRAKTFRVPDSIRATLFIENPYEISTLFDKILPELEKRGYAIASTEAPIKDLVAHGYKPTEEEAKNLTQDVIVPDLDVRLRRSYINYPDGVHEKYGYIFGKPQKSGYEDIQLRLIKQDDKSKNKIMHELLILFGPNYAKAKSVESEHVYDYLRKFKELQINLTDKTPGSNQQKVSRCIDMLQTMFNTEVSGKLFMNAKNKDYYKIDNDVPIKFSSDLIASFEKCISELKTGMKACYNERIANCKNEAERKQCEKSMRADKTTINKIETGLKNTIKYFNEEYNKVST